MSNAQNSHGQSLIVQSQPMDMAPNTQPLQQVSQQPSTTPMQITEASSRPVRKKVLIKIIDPNTGCELDLNNSLQGPPVSRFSGMFYSLTRPIQMTNLPQGPQNPPVANMSNAQNSHGQSLIVQSQPMDMAPNTQPLQQVSQQPSTTPMQITGASSRPVRKNVLIKIFDPNTGREIDLNNSLQGPPENTPVATLNAPKWSFTTGKNMTFTSRNPYAVHNDDIKPPNSPQMMSKKTTTRKLQFPRPIPSKNSSSSQPKESFEEQASELVSGIENKINFKCLNLLYEYEQMQNLDDIINSLLEDETSVIYTRFEEFVKSMSFITLDNSSITQSTVAGKIFAELVSKNILSMDAVTRGIDAVLEDSNEHLIDYPNFFSHIAAIIAPLLLSQNASLDFNNLKDFCTSIRPDNSSKFFTQVLNKILSSKETQNIKEQLGSILWIYNKWNASENVTLDVFMPNNEINKYFKNDQIGIVILSIVIYDKMKLTNNKLLYNILQSWICTNISEEIIKNPLFVKSLTIAILIVCLKLNHSYDDFFDPVHVKLLSHFIEFEPLPVHEIQAREVQCMYGIQIMSATLKHPGGMVLKLFNKLYHHRVISKESFELFIQEYEEITEI